MTSGHPDYMRVVRPRYGGAIQAEGQVVVTANTIIGLAIVQGRGMVYAGSVWLEYTLTQANSEVWLAIDDHYLSGISFFRLNEYGFTKPRNSLVSLNRYDSTNKIYSVGVSYGITFETSLVLAYHEKHGTTPTVHYRLVYALL